MRYVNEKVRNETIGVNEDFIQSIDCMFNRNDLIDERAKIFFVPRMPVAMTKPSLTQRL